MIIIINDGGIVSLRTDLRIHLGTLDMRFFDTYHRIDFAREHIVTILSHCGLSSPAPREVFSFIPLSKRASLAWEGKLSELTAVRNRCRSADLARQLSENGVRHRAVELVESHHKSLRAEITGRVPPPRPEAVLDSLM